MAIGANKTARITEAKIGTGERPKNLNRFIFVILSRTQCRQFLIRRRQARAGSLLIAQLKCVQLTQCSTLRITDQCGRLGRAWRPRIQMIVERLDRAVLTLEIDPGAEEACQFLVTPRHVAIDTSGRNLSQPRLIQPRPYSGPGKPISRLRVFRFVPRIVGASHRERRRIFPTAVAKGCA